jgi:hypothetical protein
MLDTDIPSLGLKMARQKGWILKTKGLHLTSKPTPWPTFCLPGCDGEINVHLV